MASPPSFCIEKLNAALNEAEISQHPVEVHGALVGLICGGVHEHSEGFLQPLAELMNDGHSLPVPLKHLVTDMYHDIVQRLADTDFGFTPLLPEEEEPLATRVEALSLWVQSFLTGLAVIQPKLNHGSAQLREVIQDLAEIARVELDVVDDEESEAAYAEIFEFVRVAAILCFSEFGPTIDEPKDPDSTIH